MTMLSEQAANALNRWIAQNSDQGIPMPYMIDAFLAGYLAATQDESARRIADQFVS